MPETTPAANGIAHGLQEDHARLEAAIEAAKRRKLAAEQLAAERQLEMNERLRSEVAAAQRVIAELDREHHEAVNAIRAAASAETERIRAQVVASPTRQDRNGVTDGG